MESRDSLTVRPAKLGKPLLVTARRLGQLFDVSEKKIKNMRREGKIPYFEFGHQVYRYDPADVLDALRKQAERDRERRLGPNARRVEKRGEL